MDDRALALERLEDELLGDEDDHAATMPPPPLPPGSTSKPPPALVRGGHARSSLGRGSSRSTSVATRDENPTPFVHGHRQREKKLEISCGKRKHP